MMKKLMIVDDSRLIQDRIEQINLNKGRFDIVAKANDGLEAYEKLLECYPDIVTMDLTMPNMDGVETIPKLIKAKPDLLILVVSALSDVETGIEALQHGARGFLCKPFSEIQLVEALEKVINQN